MIAGAALAVAGPAGANDLEFGTVLSGRAVALDGETLLLGDDEVRLFGVDAPDPETADGWYARAILDELLEEGQNQVQCVAISEDRDNRPVAICVFAEDYRDLGVEMIQAGWATPDRRVTYSAGSEGCPDQSAFLDLLTQLNAESPDMSDEMGIALLAAAGCKGYQYDRAEGVARLVRAGRWACSP